MIDILNLVHLQDRLVASWHLPSESSELSESSGQSSLSMESRLIDVICQQHRFNFLLWHEEDKARSPIATDETIAQVKRSIDRLNQSRNDWIEKIDQEIRLIIERARIVTDSRARRNTETPGSAMDRLSIISLRLYHLQEEVGRSDASREHQKRAGEKWDVCRRQRDELVEALQQLVDDIESGKVAHRVFSQHKMYNDPTLNPAIYGQRRVA